MNIVELVQAVGHENIKFQVLDQCITHAKAGKDGTMVTFGCNVPIADIGILGPAKKRAIILWVDRDTLDAAASGKGGGQAVDGPLSSRLRPGVECAPWVIGEVRKLEAQIAARQSHGEVVAYKWGGCLIPAEESHPFHRQEGRPLGFIDARVAQGGEAQGEAVGFVMDDTASGCKYGVLTKEVPRGARLYMHHAERAAVPEGWESYYCAEEVDRVAIGIYRRSKRAYDMLRFLAQRIRAAAPTLAGKEAKP